MGRAPCCEKDNVKRGPWTPEEDAKLLACIAQHGIGSWRTLPKKAGLQRCGKSCRLRWTNYLRPDLKHGRFTDHEEKLIVNLHAALGSRWSLIAAQLPGRTDNDVKNYWNTRLKKKLCEMGIDPITHKPISQLLADLAGSIALPKGGEIAEAALGCFKDDMLNVLMRKRPADWQLSQDQGGSSSCCIPMISTPAAAAAAAAATHRVTGNPAAGNTGWQSSWDMTTIVAAATPTARAATLSTPKNVSMLAARPSASCDMSTAVLSNREWHDSLKSNDHQMLKVGQKDGQQTMEEAAAGFQNHLVLKQRNRFCTPGEGMASTAAGTYQLPQLISNQVMQDNEVAGNVQQMPKSRLGIMILESKNDVVGGNISMSCDGILPSLMYIGRDAGGTGACTTSRSIPWSTGTNATGLGQNCSKFTVPCSSQLPILPQASILSSTPPQMFAAAATAGQQLFHNNPHNEHNSTSTSNQQLQHQSIPCSTSHNNSHNNSNNKTSSNDNNKTHVLTNYEMEPWSPSIASGSSCSSTSLMAGGGGGGGADSTGLQKVLNSDVFLWDFSDLSSIMN